MATIFMRLMNILRGRRTQDIRKADDLDDERAETGLQLSGLDGDDHTTQALSDHLGIQTRLPREGREAA